MTGLSPLNANLINNNPNLIGKKQDKHERLYHNLIAESVVVKPNKAKAVLVKENLAQSMVSSIKDFGQDCKNFFKASKTGKIDDNSLGRINDVGMKFGGLIIATFLASRAKTKTSAIMQFIGGGAFFASMSLWPKIFINLPARLVHGFRIDQKYISAQNEKKDFFLDNQYLPWDVFSEDELRKNAKKAGIDYDSENGDEKIKRKMQKTALQNRTLWMATAGFATPLMTALFGDMIEPKVKNSVIKKGVEKSKRAIEDLDTVLGKAKPIVKNSTEIDNIIHQFNSKLISPETMYKELSKAVAFDMTEMFNSPDDLKPTQGLKFTITPEELQTLRAQKSKIISANLEELLSKELIGSASESSTELLASSLKDIFGNALEDKTEKTITQQSIKEICDAFSKCKQGSKQELMEIVLKKLGGSKEESEAIISKMNNIRFEYDDTEFFNAVKKYNTEVLANIRGRLKEYLKIIDPVIGSREESVYTQMYQDAMKRVMPKEPRKFRWPIFDKTTTEKLNIIKNDQSYVRKDAYGQALINDGPSSVMSEFFRRFASMDDENYRAALEKLYTPKTDDVVQFSKKAKSDTNIEQITKKAKEFTDSTMLGRKTDELESWIKTNIKLFTNLADINNDTIRAKSLICANVERRILNNEFKQALDEKHMITKEFPLEYWINKARYMIYRGSVASDACKLEIKNEQLYMNLRSIVFDKDKFSQEKDVMTNIQDIVEQIGKLQTSKKDATLVTGLANLEKTFVTEVLNNQAWKKIFLPMSLALVAITLLVQPFFGNIKKEFPDKSKGGEQ